MQGGGEKKKRTTSGEWLQPEKVTPEDEYAAAVVCAASPSLRFPMQDGDAQ